MTSESHQRLVDSYHQEKYDKLKEHLDDYIDDEDYGDKTIH